MASVLTRRALETVDGSMEANDGDAALPRLSEPEWASSNHVTIELDAMRVVRDHLKSAASGPQHPAARHRRKLATLSAHAFQLRPPMHSSHAREWPERESRN
jgi:hypothetical protein